jgi:hypothetical protein
MPTAQQLLHLIVAEPQKQSHSIGQLRNVCGKIAIRAHIRWTEIRVPLKKLDEVPQYLHRRGRIALHRCAGILVAAIVMRNAAVVHRRIALHLNGSNVITVPDTEPSGLKCALSHAFYEHATTWQHLRMVDPQHAAELRGTLVCVRCHTESAVVHQRAPHHQPVPRLEYVEVDDLPRKASVADEEREAVVRRFGFNLLGARDGSFWKNAGNYFSQINCERKTPSLISRIELARS